LYKSDTKITYYGDDMQVVVYEINYAPAMTLLEDSTDIRLGDKYSTKTQVTLYIKEEGSAFLTYDFPVTVDVSVTDSRTMLVEDEEVEVFELTIKDAYNWSNIETYCEKSKRTDKYICPSEKFKPKFLTRKLYLAKGIGPVRFVGEENVFGFGDWVDRANSEPIIDIIDRY
ncbi:hypothetical protein KKA47_03020, partial [bacterium]|nr:hypothetical protein [bacterium]